MLHGPEVYFASRATQLAAILAADVAGYSRLMAADESGTLGQIRRLRAEVFEPKIAHFHGRIVGSAGDSLLVEFASAVLACSALSRSSVSWTAKTGACPKAGAWHSA